MIGETIVMKSHRGEHMVDVGVAETQVSRGVTRMTTTGETTNITVEARSTTMITTTTTSAKT